MQSNVALNVPSLLQVSLSPIHGSGDASSEELLLTASLNTQRIEVSVSLPRGLTDLTEQLKGGSATKGALRALSAMLGDLLFAGPMLPLMRGLMSQSEGEREGEPTPHAVLLLTLPQTLADLPWELCADPETGALFVGEGRELVRVAGAPAPSTPLRNEGVVIATPAESYRLSALKAAATQLRRRFNTSIEPVQHPSALKERLGERGPLFCHLYALDRLGRVTVDPNHPSLFELTGLQNTHLVNCSPQLPNSVSHQTRVAGASLVLSRQFDLSVKASAESDRALYHSFGSGASALVALSEARASLRATHPEGYEWASLTLTVAPPSHPDAWASSPAFEPFPPQRLTGQPTGQPTGQNAEHAGQSASVGEHTRDQDALQKISRPAPLAPMTPPVRAVEFVNRTVQLVQSTQRGGSDEEKLDLALRTSVMKQLSALAKRRGVSGELTRGLTRSEVLTQQLIAASRFEESALKPVAQWYGHAEAIAQEVGVKVEGVAQAAQALLMSNTIWLCGADALTRVRLARGLCESMYQSYPLERDGVGPLYPVLFKDSAEGGLNGPLWESAQLSWAPGSASPFEGDKTRPSTRASVAAYHSEVDAWRLYERLWVIVDQAELSAPDERYRAARALREGVLRGLTESGRAARCYLPADQRVIYLSDEPPEQAHGAVVIHLAYQPESAARRWVHEVRTRLLRCGVSPLEVERRLTLPLTISVSYVLSLCLDLNVCTPESATACLSYGALAGADKAHFEEALELYVHQGLHKAQAHTQECIRAYAWRDEAIFEARWREQRAEAPAPNLPLIEVSL